MQRIGTAGWSVPKGTPAEGTRLYRYSRVLSSVEINSTFYRAHRASTWKRWVAETPPDFRFAIKAPKTITHEARLQNVESLLKIFLEQLEPVREKMGPILFQLPPSLAFDSEVAEEFLDTLRSLYQGEVALEPRHATWFPPAVDTLLKRRSITRVAADPPRGEARAAEPGGDTNLAYYRLHGSPQMYYSNYEDSFLSSLATRINRCSNAWIVFDNTALAHAYANARTLQELVRKCGTS